jgi:hypothetical protein
MQGMNSMYSEYYFFSTSEYFLALAHGICTFTQWRHKPYLLRKFLSIHASLKAVSKIYMQQLPGITIKH